MALDLKELRQLTAPELAEKEKQLAMATAERILETENIQDIPLVFLSALVSKNEVEARGEMIGGRKFMAKPVTCDELIEMIDSLPSQ